MIFSSETYAMFLLSLKSTQMSIAQPIPQQELTTLKNTICFAGELNDD